MWIFCALVAMLGSVVWYVGPKIFPAQNPFSVMFFWSLFSLVPFFILSKLFYGERVDVQGIKLGALYLLSCFGTVGLIFSLNAGGKIGPVSVIVELSIILSVLIGVFLFQEHLNPWQIIGILMAIAGVGLVIFFEGR
jgi:drug/metabolite transporter (DMT)-like permease